MRRVLACSLLLLLLGGCAYIPGGLRSSNPYYPAGAEQYYTGTRGVEAAYQDIPSLVFYSVSGVPATGGANTFPLTVEVENQGASYARGGIFISGYDPAVVQLYLTTNGQRTMISPIPQNACAISASSFLGGQLGFSFACGSALSVSSTPYNPLSLTANWLSGNTAGSLGYSSGGGGSFAFNVGGVGYEQRAHGIGLITMLSGLSFSRLYGQEFLLAGNTYEHPGGERAYLTYEGVINRWPPGADSLQQHFMLTSCYLYTTFAAPMVCIDPSPYSTGSRVCSAQALSYSGNGGPVVISSIRQESTPLTAAFHITVQNRGGGTVFDPGAIEKCSPYYVGGARAADMDVVWIGEAWINDVRLQCTPSPYLRLQNGQAEFTCLYDMRANMVTSAYMTPLIIELWYGYSKVQDRVVTIKRV